MFKKISADHPMAYFFVAFIAMAGLAYINFLPGLVDALAGGMGFSDSEAGKIVALNGFGGIAGSIIAIFVMNTVKWQRALGVLFTLLTATDLFSVWIATISPSNITVMLACRFLAGVFGGVCVGIAISVVARLHNPDRAFGLLLFLQFSIGAIVIYLLPGIEASYGAFAVFYVMASFALLSLASLPFIPAVPFKKNTYKHSKPSFRVSGKTWQILLAIVLYQAAASAIWAYAGLIGLSFNIVSERVSTYIAITGMLGLFGAMLPILTGYRFGRVLWLTGGAGFSLAGSLLLIFTQSASLYVVGLTLLFFSWPAVLSFLLAASAELDASGKTSTTASAASYIGLASGPLLGSVLLENRDFTLMLYTCAIIFLFALLLFFKPVYEQDKTRSGTVFI